MARHHSRKAVTTQDDLAAGRELDALIAEKVFGYVAWTVPRHAGAHAGDVVWLMQPRDAILAPPPELPYYSTDIGAAWKVLDEMVWRVGTADIRLDMEDYGRGAGTDSGAERAVWVTIGEHTAFGPAPLAICCAARAAVKEQP